MSRGTVRTTEKAKERFIEALRECPMVAQRWWHRPLVWLGSGGARLGDRAQDPDFRAAWEDALEEGMDVFGTKKGELQFSVLVSGENFDPIRRIFCIRWEDMAVDLEALES